MTMNTDISLMENRVYDDYSNPNMATFNDLVRGVKVSMPELFTHTFEDMLEDLTKGQDLLRPHNSR